LLKSVYSIMLVVQIIAFLYKTETGEILVGHSQEKEREREKEASGLREQEVEHK
jgi:hypothetical protein